MRRPTVHLICNAHLDPVWQWRWEEGCAEALSTFRNAVQLIHEHDRLIFNHNEALLYRWVREYNPELFKEIQKLVVQGRWSISGGWYLQPDVNLPGVESLIRQITEGRRFFKEHFNAEPQVAYNFDSFGHTGGLPQLLLLSGYKMYIHMRPQHHELELPSDLYRWRGVDGSEIIGLRIAVGLYHTERDNIEQRVSEGVKLALKLQRDVPLFWGIGNHGGGPTREDLAKIDAYVEKETRVDIIHSTPDRLLKALKEVSQDAPVIQGDLQRVFTGCYTSLSRIKRRAQESLGQLVQAETLQAVAWWAYDQPYPENELGEAWRDHLLNDFHDILPGSCTEPAEQDALDLYGRVAETVRRLRIRAAVIFNRGTPEPLYIPVTVLNTNPSLKRVPIEVECMLDLRPKWTGTWHLRLFRLDGTEVECQEEQPESLLPFNGWRRKVCFLADVPGAGSANYKLQILEGKRDVIDRPPLLRHTIDSDTGLIKTLDAGEGRECLTGPLFQPLVMDDDGDSWGTDRWSYRQVVGTFEPVSKCTVVEYGPIRKITESLLVHGHSRIVFHTIAYAQWPAIEFRLRITWNEVRKRLKLSVPTVFKSNAVLCEIPGGAIERPADGQEHVHGRWFILEGTLRGHATALAVVNSGQHGLDFSDGEVRLSVLRSAAYCHEQGFPIGERPVRKYMDVGVHVVRLLVTAGNADNVREKIAGLADWLSAPPVSYSHLPIGTKQDFTEILSIAPANIRLIACKQSWDGKALIVRLHETAGISTVADVVLAPPGIRASVPLKPYAIRTLRFEKSGEWREVDLVNER